MFSCVCCVPPSLQFCCIAGRFSTGYHIDGGSCTSASSILGSYSSGGCTVGWPPSHRWPIRSRKSPSNEVRSIELPFLEEDPVVESTNHASEDDIFTNVFALPVASSIVFDFIALFFAVKPPDMCTLPYSNFTGLNAAKIFFPIAATDLHWCATPPPRIWWMQLRHRELGMA